MGRWLPLLVLATSGLARADLLPCPAPGTVSIQAENLSPDDSISLRVRGELLSAASDTCGGGGPATYDVTLTCTGHGTVSCGTLPPIQPGAWVHHADVQVTGSSNNGSPPVGSPFAYTFQVKDNGSQGASGVIFDDTLPATIGLSGVSTNVGTCTSDPTAGRVHCDLGDLAVGQQATIVINAAATATGTVTDTASTAMTGPDLQPANNTVGVTVQPR